MHFPTLAILVIRETNITDLGIESLLYECPKLRVLDIALTQIRGDGLRDLSTKCPLLESLEIYHPLDLAIGLPHISKCTLIHTLAGVECYDFDDEVFSPHSPLSSSSPPSVLFFSPLPCSLPFSFPNPPHENICR